MIQDVSMAASTEGMATTTASFLEAPWFSRAVAFSTRTAESWKPMVKYTNQSVKYNTMVELPLLVPKIWVQVQVRTTILYYSN